MYSQSTDTTRQAATMARLATSETSSLPRLDHSARKRWEEAAPQEKLNIALDLAKKAPARPEGNAPVLLGQVQIRIGGKTSRPFNGLIDTGAAASVIPKILMTTWEVEPAGKTALQGFDGPLKEYDRYWVEIVIPDLEPRLLCLAATNRTDVLIGRDILDKCLFIYDGRHGSYSLYEPNLFGRLMCRICSFGLRIRDRLFGGERIRGG
jgi:hypothetical protein